MKELSTFFDLYLYVMKTLSQLSETAKAKSKIAHNIEIYVLVKIIDWLKQGPSYWSL